MTEKKIRVLHFPIANSNGGITRSAMKYWKYIDHTRFQFDFATCSSKLDFENTILEQGCKIHYISCKAEQDSRKFRRELKSILDNGYDVIHLNTNWWKGFLAEQTAIEAGVKNIIVHARTTYIELNNEKDREQEYIRHEENKRTFNINLANHFLACSKDAADFLYGEQIPRDKITIFHNALDIDRYSYNEYKRMILRNELNINDKYVIGDIGRFAYPKNMIFLIDVFYEIQKKVDDSILMLIGNGELEKELKKKVRDYEIEKKVLFIGAVDNVEDYLQAMDVFAFPSHFEGLGNVLIEAQTAGLKCIASQNVPMETKITDNVVYLELNRDLWMHEILKYQKGYQRMKTDLQVRKHGYDIKEEIKVLEKIYSDF